MTAHVVHTLSKKVSKMSKAEYNLSKNKGNVLELSGRMTRMCFESPNLQGMGAGQKRAGVGRAGYVKWEVQCTQTSNLQVIIYATYFM